jgi:hypothetical protein
MKHNEDFTAFCMNRGVTAEPAEKLQIRYESVYMNAVVCMRGRR